MVFDQSSGLPTVILLTSGFPVAPVNAGGTDSIPGDWEDSLEEEMTTHSSILAWRIPQTEEPGGLQSMQSQRVGHAEH